MKNETQNKAILSMLLKLLKPLIGDLGKEVIPVTSIAKFIDKQFLYPTFDKDLQEIVDMLRNLTIDYTNKHPQSTYLQICRITNAFTQWKQEQLKKAESKKCHKCGQIKEQNDKH